MPSKAPRPCRAKPCSNVTIDKSGFCDDHADRRQSWTTGRAGRGRGGRPWRRKRKIVAQRANGLCQICIDKGVVKQGEICDHIIPEAEGGTDELTNLQWICTDCNTVKTREESSRGRARSA